MDKIDILNRDAFVKQLITITENISNSKKSTSFAINGIWGSGKSFVLDMFEEQLKQIQSSETSTDKYFIIRYNCWECDYYEEPLIAIVATMLDTIEKKTQVFVGEKREKIKGVLKAIGATLFSVVNGAIKNTTGVDLTEAYEIVDFGIQLGKEEYKKANEYDMYFSFKKALKCLQEVLNELSEHYTVIFLIDELDRCLPEYAIKVLERLHHLMEGTQNVIHVISIDMGQLQKSVQHIFGFDNTREYLKKFIRFTISLDLGKVSNEFFEKNANYIELFDPSIIPYEDSIEDFVQQIFCDIDVRNQEQLIDRISLVHSMLFSDKKDYGFMCMELLIGVMFTYYKRKKRFCNWFEQFWGTIEAGLTDPPFANFLDKKFKDIPQSKSIGAHAMGVGNGIVLKKANSIYSSIAYIWLKLIIGEDSMRAGIYVSDNSIRCIWENSINELNDFIEMMGIIKNK